MELGLFDDGGRLVSPRDGGETLCDAVLGRAGGCGEFYRKMVQQVVRADEIVLFRCPAGTLVFGAPIRFEGAGAIGVLVGGPVVPLPEPDGVVAQFARIHNVTPTDARTALGGLPRLEAKRFQKLAGFTQFCLRTVMRGSRVRADASRRQGQILTLFELAGDLALASSPHEIYALALNTLGVLFEVPSAAVLSYEPGTELLRVHTAMGPMERTLLTWSTPLRDTPLEALGRPGEVVRIDDTHRLARLGLPEEVEAVAVFSLALGDRIGGGILVVNPNLQADDEPLIQGFATEIAMASELQRLTAESARKTQQLQAVRALSHQFTANLDPERLFGVILEEAQNLTGARKGSLMVAPNGNGELQVKAVSGLNDRVVERLRLQSGEGIAGSVYSSGEPLLVTNIERDTRFARKNRPRYVTKSFLSLPIRMDNRVVGVLNLSDKLNGDVFSPEDLDLLQTISAQATVAIERSTYYAQSKELRKISITDSLTGLLNRRYFQERLAEEVDRSTRHDSPLSLIMLDIDHFKRYNDANGHLEGDKALILVGRILRASIRAIDVVSRFGGEEFSVILPETRKQEAVEIGERIRSEIERLCFPGEEALPSGRLTVSLGVAGFPEDARDLKSLIHKSDRALYRAKDLGRNRIVLYEADATAAPDAPPKQDAWTRVL